MTIAFYGQAVTSARHHHLAATLFSFCPTGSYGAGLLELGRLKILFNSELALAVPAVVSR